MSTILSIVTCAAIAQGVREPIEEGPSDPGPPPFAAGDSEDPGADPTELVPWLPSRRQLDDGTVFLYTPLGELVGYVLTSVDRGYTTPGSSTALQDSGLAPGFVGLEEWVWVEGYDPRTTPGTVTAVGQEEPVDLTPFKSQALEAYCAEVHYAAGLPLNKAQSRLKQLGNHTTWTTMHLRYAVEAPVVGSVLRVHDAGLQTLEFYALDDDYVPPGPGESLVFDEVVDGGTSLGDWYADNAGRFFGYAAFGVADDFAPGDLPSGVTCGD